MDQRPFGEGARRLIRAAREHITGLMQRYDQLVPYALAGRDRWVVTHGEPHTGNVMRLPGDGIGGGIRLIDWDTVRLAPPERDLWMISPGEPDADSSIIELYQRWWELAEICDYANTLRAAHDEDANTRIAWRELQTYLAAIE